MNRKLLFALPLFMALSACAGVNINNQQRNFVNVNGIVEDTKAHEEIFGNAAEINVLKPKKVGDFGGSSDILMGYQMKFDDNGDAVASNDTISIRFIAAIKNTDSRAYWDRAVCNGAGSEGAEVKKDDWRYKITDAWLESTSLYSTLTNGEDIITVEGESPYKEYAGFVIYTMLDIPYESFKDFYLGANLTLVPNGGGDYISSNFVGVKIEKQALKNESVFAFSIPKNPSAHEGFVLAGSIHNKLDYAKADSTTRGSNNVSFISTLFTDDTFVFVQKTDSNFKIWDGSCLQTTPVDGIEEENNVFKSTKHARFSFYLKSDVIYAAEESGTSSYGLRGDINTWGYTSMKVDPEGVDNRNKGFLLGVTFAVGQAFKITLGENWNEATLLNSSKLESNSYFEDEDGESTNIVCKEAGVYDIYVNSSTRIFVAKV